MKILLLLFVILIGGCASTGWEGREWTLVEITTANDERLVPRDRARYTVTFGEDGMVRGRADCNSFGGRYSINGDRMQTGRLAVTRAACPSGSISGVYLNALSEVHTYTTTGGDLVLEFGAGAGPGTIRYR